jgi:NAD(P)-dependent dehydrogenase (short-subunit alcohol dehydrogenase family)
MIVNEAIQRMLAARAATGVETLKNLLPVEMVEPIDISNAVLWLVSDAARYVTGVTLPVDAGFAIR